MVAMASATASSPAQPGRQRRELPGTAWHGMAWRGMARRGMARRGAARHGKAGRGGAWRGKARQGKAGFSYRGGRSVKPLVTTIAKREPVEATRRKAPSLKDQVAILKKQAVCFMCGEPFTGKQIEFDHAIPLGLGGLDESVNMNALCAACHRRKSSADVALIAKAKRRIRQATEGRGRKPKGKPLKSRGFGKTLRRKFDGTVERIER